MNHLFGPMRPLAGVLAGMALLIGPAVGVAAAQEATETAETWGTPEQVERGEAAYGQKCSICHGNEIVSVFKSFPTAGQFFAFVSTTMPGDAPGSLPMEQYADIIAFLAAENGMELGEQDLPPDPAILDTIRPSTFGASQ